MEELKSTDNQNDKPPLQPESGWGFFRFLAITSFIGSGMGAVVFLFVALFFDLFDENLLKQMEPEQMELTSQMLSGGRFFFVITGLLYVSSFAGVLMMWSKRKSGLHVYSISQICILIMPLAFVSGFPVSIVNVILTAAYIWGYATYSRYFPQ